MYICVFFFVLFSLCSLTHLETWIQTKRGVQCTLLKHHNHHEHVSAWLTFTIIVTTIQSINETQVTSCCTPFISELQPIYVTLCFTSMGRWANENNTQLAKPGLSLSDIWDQDKLKAKYFFFFFYVTWYNTFCYSLWRIFFCVIALQGGHQVTINQVLPAWV